MAWTTPSTAVAGSTALTAAFWNEQVRDNTLAIRAAQINVKQTALATKPSSTSAAYTDITGFSVTITPSSASSKVLIIISANFGLSAADSNVTLKLLRGATAIHGSDDGDAFAWFRGLSASAHLINFPVSSVYLDSPNTTSATTYKVQWSISPGTVYLNRRGFDENTDTTSSITAIEIPV